jgi:nucleoside-diphosphate-sugar epimerase
MRYHNIYGAGEDSKGATPGDIHVIPALLEKVISGQYPLELLGDPAATRPFTYVDDAVAATVEIVERAARNDESAKNTDFNIGNNKYYTILELAQVIWKMYGDGREFAYKVIETSANTALRREVDITKIKETLGWEPKVSLEDGLKPTGEWIKRRRAGGKKSLWA